MRIENVKIYTMNKNRDVIERGYVEIEDGKIVSVGPFEGEGEVTRVLYPGLIDAHTHVGIIGDALGFESDDVNETGDPLTPHLRALDAINPFDRCFADARGAGVTTVAIAPGSANPIGGQICVVKTVGRRIDDMALLSPAAVKFALGENPKGCYHSKSQMPETRMATAAMMREMLTKAKKYADDMDAAHSSPSNPDEEAPDEPDFDIKLESLIPVIKGEIPCHFHCHRADDICTAIRIAKEFNLKYVLVHCTEGSLIADILASEGACAIVGPNLSDRSKPELLNQTYQNPALLAKEGVKIAITTDHSVTPINYLSLCASLAKQSGLPYMNALSAITCDAADILGISDRVGSIECEKDADLVLMNGDIFDLNTKIECVWIDGVQCGS